MKKYMVVFITFFAFWGFIFGSSIISGMGSTALPVSKDSKAFYASILPQGWGFFSKSPRDVLWGLSAADNKSEEVLWPNMRVENLFGLYRKGRSQGVEMGNLSTHISEKDWVSCKDNNTDDCKRDAKKITIKNNTPSPLLCGEYYFSNEKIVPWSYFKYSESAVEVEKIVKADIVCKNS